MSRRRILVLLGALLVILIAGAGLYIHSATSASSSVQIVATSRCITANTQMTPAIVKADFRIEKVAPSRVPNGAYIFTSESALDAYFMQDGQPTYYTREPVAPGACTPQSGCTVCS